MDQGGYEMGSADGTKPGTASRTSRTYYMYFEI